MMAGSKISCMGIVGDGCGGGREFIVQDGIFYAYDELTQDKIILLRDIDDAREINKHGCIITIICKKETIEFDLSTLKRLAIKNSG